MSCRAKSLDGPRLGGHNLTWIKAVQVKTSKCLEHVHWEAFTLLAHWAHSGVRITRYQMLCRVAVHPRPPLFRLSARPGLCPLGSPHRRRQACWASRDAAGLVLEARQVRCSKTRTLRISSTALVPSAPAAQPEPCPADPRLQRVCPALPSPGNVAPNPIRECP